IILDPAVLNVLRFELGYDTTEIAIGDNLMVSQLVTDLMKLNRSFVVHRSAPRAEVYQYSLRLSTYIRQAIEHNRVSVWLAHRNGRAKDGLDQTHTGLLKMLNMSGEGSVLDNFRSLNIVPMAISYEYEPCDFLRAEELVHQQLDLPYQKDDKIAIIRGIRDPKGRVHLAIGAALDDQFYDQIDPRANRNAQIRQLCAAFDREIVGLYKLWPNHYIALDRLNGKRDLEAHYSAEEEAAFDQWLDKRLAKASGPPDYLRQVILDMYANPVRNTMRLNG
ncbi:MAG: glycerol acyltransferase, partial [Bacteroidota bacterium]